MWALHPIIKAILGVLGAQMAKPNTPLGPQQRDRTVFELRTP